MTRHTVTDEDGTTATFNITTRNGHYYFYWTWEDGLVGQQICIYGIKTGKPYYKDNTLGKRRNIQLNTEETRALYDYIGA